MSPDALTLSPVAIRHIGRKARRHRVPTRAGMSLIELVIACLLVGSIAGFILPTASWMVVERQGTLERQVAGEELANLMDRLTRQSWDQITVQDIRRLGLSPELEHQLRGAVLTVAVDTDDQAKRIGLSLTWKSRSGRPVAPIRLTTWVYPPPNAQAASTQRGDT